MAGSGSKFSCYAPGARQPRSVSRSPASASRPGFPSHPTNADAVLLDRNSAKFAGHAVAEFVRMAHRIFAWERELAQSAGCSSGNRESGSSRAARRRIRSASPVATTKSQIGRPVKHGSRVLESALAVIESGTDEPINSGDLCRAAGVSERTLRNVFYRNFGISPHRYLMLEKLHRARVALARSAARRHGLQHLRQSRAVGRGEIRRPLSPPVWSPAFAGPGYAPAESARQASNGAISGPALAAHRYPSHGPGPL